MAHEKYLFFLFSSCLPGGVLIKGKKKCLAYLGMQQECPLRLLLLMLLLVSVKYTKIFNVHLFIKKNDIVYIHISHILIC